MVHPRYIQMRGRGQRTNTFADKQDVWKWEGGRLVRIGGGVPSLSVSEAYHRIPTDKYIAAACKGAGLGVLREYKLRYDEKAG